MGQSLKNNQILFVKNGILKKSRWIDKLNLGNELLTDINSKYLTISSVHTI